MATRGRSAEGDLPKKKPKSWAPGKKQGAPPIDVPGAEEEDVVVIGHDAVHEAGAVEPGALGLRLHGGDDVGKAEHLQQLLALPKHLPRGRIHPPGLLPMLRLQRLEGTQVFFQLFKSEW